MPHVSEGARTYLPGTDKYGNVVRTTVLGTPAIVVECDDGSMKAFCGDGVNEEVYDKETGKNGKGATLELPTDVAVIGPDVLASVGLDAQNQMALFQKFMVLEPTLRREKAKYWEEHKDDAEKMAEFLPELMELLGADTLYIETQAGKVLGHLDNDTRAKMMTDFMNVTTEDDRMAMIIRYTAVSKDKIQKEEFLQDMYKLVLDNGTYITMEFQKSLCRHVSEETISSLTESFLSKNDDSLINDIVETWRSFKYYTSSRGHTFAWNVLRQYS